MTKFVGEGWQVFCSTRISPGQGLQRQRARKRKLANEKQEPWKKSLPEFIEEIYFKRFKKRQPDIVRSIEQLVQDQREKKEERKARRDKPENQ